LVPQKRNDLGLENGKREVMVMKGGTANEGK